MKISKTSPLRVRPLTGPGVLSPASWRRATRTLVQCALAVITIVIAAGLAVKHRRAGSPLWSPEFVRLHEEFSGTVEQAIATGPYTYFALRTPSGQLRWVVTMSRAHRDAKWLHVESFGSREDFASLKLQRRFKRLYFVSVRKHSG